MTDNTEEESLAHIREITNQHTNHLVRSDPEIDGKVDIEVRSDGRYNVFVYKGGSDKARKIEDISKEKLLSMIKSNL